MDEGLRLAIVAGSFSPALDRLIRYRTDEEQEQLRLTVICRPERLELAEAEVSARAERLAAYWSQMPDEPPAMTPRAAALRSVIREVMEGVLPF